MSFGRAGCTLRAVGAWQSFFLGLTADEEMTKHGPWFGVSVVLVAGHARVPGCRLDSTN